MDRIFFCACPEAQSEVQEEENEEETAETEETAEENGETQTAEESKRKEEKISCAVKLIFSCFNIHFFHL